MRRVFLFVICVALGLAMILSGYLIFNYYLDQLKAESAYDELSEFAMSEEAEATEPILNSTADDTTETTEDPETDSLASVAFEKLTAEYPDTVGWLYCEGTPINYPVVQSKDNLRYLRRLPDGRYNAAGSLFADYRCKEVAASGNYIIYGHNMKNGSMFGTLVRYKSQNYYDEHPTLYYLTPERTFRIELIAGFVTSPAGEVYDTQLSAEQVRQLCTRSSFKNRTIPQDGDTFIALSTCSYEYEDARYVVIGRVIEIVKK